jgi:hypothetical protein
MYIFIIVTFILNVFGDMIINPNMIRTFNNHSLDNKVKRNIDNSCNTLCQTIFKQDGIDYLNEIGSKIGCRCTTICCDFDHCDNLCLDKSSTLILYDYECGPNHHNKNCSGLWKCDCCSSRGYCGRTEEYCSVGCQQDYGKCWSWKVVH